MTKLDTAYDALVRDLALHVHQPFYEEKLIKLAARGVIVMQKQKFSGAEKKACVLRAMKTTVQQSLVIPDSVKTHHLHLIDTVGESIIHNLVCLGRDKKTFKGSFLPNCFSSLKSLITCKTCKNNSINATIDPTDPSDPIYAALVNYLQILLQKPITAAKVFDLLNAAVTFVQQYTALTGAEKKTLVINALLSIIAASNLSASEQAALNDILNTFGDLAIDMFVEFGQDAVTFVESKCTCCSSSTTPATA